MRRDVFQAIADPNRRMILSMLATGRLNVNQVADNFDITRSAVSQHMKILTECGLVTIRKSGRERYCEAKLDKLGEIWDWLNQYKKFWENKFDAMEIALKEIQSKNKQDGNKKMSLLTPLQSRRLTLPASLMHPANWFLKCGPIPNWLKNGGGQRILPTRFACWNHGLVVA